MSIPSIGATPPARPLGAVVASAQPVQAPAPLAPAVRVEIRSRDRSTERPSTPEGPPDSLPPPQAVEAPMESRIRIDRETRAVVYQKVDPGSGDVVVQLPDPVVLKARAYAQAAEARSRQVSHPLDRTA